MSTAPETLATVTALPTPDERQVTVISNPSGTVATGDRRPPEAATPVTGKTASKSTAAKTATTAAKAKGTTTTAAAKAEPKDYSLAWAPKSSARLAGLTQATQYHISAVAEYAKAHPTFTAAECGAAVGCSALVVKYTIQGSAEGAGSGLSPGKLHYKDGGG